MVWRSSSWIIPVFLGGINVGLGNTPPWTLPAKAKYSEYDRRRATRYFGVPDFTAPACFLPILSLLSQRAMTYIKATYDRERFETTFLLLWQHLFYKHRDISKPEILANCSPRTRTSRHPKCKRSWRPPTGSGGKMPSRENKGGAGKRRVRGSWFWVVNGDGEGTIFLGVIDRPLCLSHLKKEHEGEEKANSRLPLTTTSTICGNS
ncbi:hypothetical protein VTN00DRAFT_5765 [Thermoascus crustaceus]|uniref:uncharacterized protein n=1 Tax=Thermoascus crustaceus TaxID=5088 RepID=UPI003743687C